MLKLSLARIEDLTHKFFILLKKGIKIGTMRFHDKNWKITNWFGNHIGLGETQSYLLRRIGLFNVSLGIISVTVPQVSKILKYQNC